MQVPNHEETSFTINARSHLWASSAPPTPVRLAAISGGGGSGSLTAVVTITIYKA